MAKQLARGTPNNVDDTAAAAAEASEQERAPTPDSPALAQVHLVTTTVDSAMAAAIDTPET